MPHNYLGLYDFFNTNQNLEIQIRIKSHVYAIRNVVPMSNNANSRN